MYLDISSTTLLTLSLSLVQSTHAATGTGLGTGSLIGTGTGALRGTGTGRVNGTGSPFSTGGGVFTNATSGAPTTSSRATLHGTGPRFSPLSTTSGTTKPTSSGQTALSSGSTISSSTLVTSSDVRNQTSTLPPSQTSNNTSVVGGKTTSTGGGTSSTGGGTTSFSIGSSSSGSGAATTTEFTSDITAGTSSSSTTSGPGPITTFSVFPTISPSTITDSTVTSGSHVDVTNSGKSTPVPVLPDSKHGCWFCPPGPGGFVLPGFSLPGVYPPGGPPAGFPTPFPAITVGPNGDPSFETEPTSKPTDGSTSTDSTSKDSSSTASTTTSSCPTATVTDCSTSLSYGVNSAGSTTTTATVSSCTPRSGCSVTGSTVTTTSASTATGCWSYDYGFDSGSDPEDTSDDSLAKRDLHGIAGRRGLADTLIRRGKAEPVSVVGSNNKCTLSMSGAAATVTIPAYPGANDLEGHSPNGAKWWYVPTTSASAGGCPTLTMTSYPNAAALTAGPVMTGLAGGSGTYSLGGTEQPLVNVDHVYELKFFKNFVNSLLDDNQISCSDFNDFFMAEDPSAGKGVPRFQVLYNMVPSNDNPDFAGMDSRINAVKGWLFNNALDGIPNTKKKGFTDAQRLQLLNEMAAAIDFTNSPDIAPLLQKTNTRIYEAWRGVDDLIAAQSACGNAAPKPAKSAGAGWADVYSSFMTSLFSTQNVQITSQLSSMTNPAFYQTLTTTAGEPNSVANGLKAFTDAYPTGKWTYDANALLAWPTTAAATLQKRGAPACTKPATTSASATATTTSSSSSSSSSPSSSSSSSKAPPPPPPPPPPPACTQEVISGGRAGIIGRECHCDDGSSPQPTIVAGEYQCPNQVQVIG